MKFVQLNPLPPETLLKTPDVMRVFVEGHRYLAELKGTVNPHSPAAPMQRVVM